MADEHGSQQPVDESRQAHERFLLPLLVPALAFLFAVLVIYGLSRIYLELDQWKYRTVSMATPLAIGVALLILLISTYLASRPSISRLQIGGVVLLAMAGLTGGAIWAAVHPDSEVTAIIQPTPSVTGGPTAPAGAVQVELTETPFSVKVNPASAPAGSVTFSVKNVGSITHDLRVIKTDQPVDKLPYNDAAFQVDETKVDVVQSVKSIDPGNTAQVTGQLEAGSYVLICNVATHYQSGMRVAFKVQ